MPDTTTQIPRLEKIDFNDFSPIDIVDKKLPSIGFKGVIIIGFTTEKQLDKYMRDTNRQLTNAKILFDSEVDRKNLRYTIRPKDGYGRTK